MLARIRWGWLRGENVYALAPNVQMWIDPLGLACEPKKITRRQAFNQAKRDAGIPTSSSPIKQKWVNEYGSKGDPQRVYQFDVDGKKKYIIEHPPDKNGRGSHFHVAGEKYEGQDLFTDGERYKNLGKSVPGVKEHYPEEIGGFQ